MLEEPLLPESLQAPSPKIDQFTKVPLIGWLFQKIVNLSNQNTLPHLLKTRIDSTRNEGSLFFSALRTKIQSVAETMGAIKNALSGSVPDGESLATLSKVNIDQEQAILELCRLHLIIFRDILAYQCAIWFPSTSPTSRSKANSVPNQFRSIDQDLITLNERCLARALQYRSLLLKFGTRLQDETEWAILTLSLPLNSLQPSSNVFNSVIPNIDLSPFLVLKEKAGLSLEKLCQARRSIRGRPGLPGSPNSPSRLGEPDEALILGQTEYVLSILSNVKTCSRARLVPEISVMEMRRDLVNRGRLGIWMGLQAGLDGIRIVQALDRCKTEVGHGKPEVATETDRTSLSSVKVEVTGAETEPIPKQASSSRITVSNAEKAPTPIQTAFLHVLAMISEIPDDLLLEVLTQSRPWLPRLHGDAIRLPSVANSSGSDDTTESESGSDSEERPRPTTKVMIPVKRPRPVLQDLFSFYESYQEQRLAIYLRWPAQVRNKVVLTKYMEEGVVGNVWKRQISRAMVVLGYDEMLELGMDQEQLDSWQDLYPADEEASQDQSASPPPVQEKKKPKLTGRRR